MRSTFDLTGKMGWIPPSVFWRDVVIFLQIQIWIDSVINETVVPGQSSNRNLAKNRNALDIDNAQHAGHKQCADEHKFTNEPRDQWVELNENYGRKKTSRRSSVDRDADDDVEKRKMIILYIFVYMRCDEDCIFLLPELLNTRLMSLNFNGCMLLHASISRVYPTNTQQRTQSPQSTCKWIVGRARARARSTSFRLLVARCIKKYHLVSCWMVHKVVWLALDRLQISWGAH